MSKKIHFTGIGGIGMSALAWIYLNRGYEVSGSDLRPNDMTARLENAGATVLKGHSTSNVPEDADMLIKTTCIKEDNPEIIAAQNAGVSVISRSQLLKRTMDEFPESLAVTGTHGKTTTSALISHITRVCGLDPTVAIGGQTAILNGNARAGKSGWMIAEVDESCGHFRNIKAKNAIITNIEREHMENYGSLDELVRAYSEFIEHLPENGFLVENIHDRITRNELRATGLARRVSFGFSPRADYSCAGAEHKKGIRFRLMIRGRQAAFVRSPLSGKYNVMNILAAVAACCEAGISAEDAAEAAAGFKGVKRRFETKGTIGSIKVIEDYAHHPTEIRSVIQTAREHSGGRVIAVFQPHRYSRTIDLMGEFRECFHGADVLILTSIYSADENRNAEVSISDLYDTLDTSSFDRVCMAEKDDIPRMIGRKARQGDIILLLGAGDIRDISNKVVNSIRKENRNERTYSG